MWRFKFGWAISLLLSREITWLNLNLRTFYVTELNSDFMFQHCQPMRNHDTEQLQEGNRKINSEKVLGQSSSIQLVHPLYTSMHSPLNVREKGTISEYWVNQCAVHALMSKYENSTQQSTLARRRTPGHCSAAPR